MRALETLILALIVGILGSTDARQRILEAYGSARFYAKLLNPINYENLRDDCRNNGGPEAYDHLSQNLQRFSEDIRRFVMYVNYDVELGRPYLRVGKSLFHDDCYEVPVIRESLRHVTESLQACVKTEMRERVLIDSRVIDSFMQYICGSSGHDLARFVYADGLQCLASNQRGLLRCAKQSFDHYLPGAEFIGDGISELKGAEILLHLNSKRCADVAQFRNCSVELLKKCEDRMSDGVFDNIIRPFTRPSTYCVGSFDDKPTRTLAVEEMSTIGGTSVGVPIVDDFVDFVSDKCAKNGGKRAFRALKDSWKLFVNGYLALVDMPWDRTEQFDTVLQRYCRRGVILNDYKKYLTDTFKSCLAQEEQTSVDIVENTASRLLRELCDNEGRGIAAFFAASGSECLISKTDDIEYCANQTLGISGDGIDWQRPLERLQRPLVIDAEDCTDLAQLRHCTVGAFMECENKTSVHLVDSMFGIIQNEMSCQNLSVPQTTTSAA